LELAVGRLRPAEEDEDGDLAFADPWTQREAGTPGQA
jgi:hypothetical protein